MKSRFYLALILMACPSAASATSLIITPVWGSTLAADANHAAIENVINSAIGFYETEILNPIDVTITFDLSTASLGTSTWTANSLSYSSYYNALVSSSTSATDATAVAHLPSGSTDPVDNSSNVVVKTALQAALGLNGQGANVAGQKITVDASQTTTGIGTGGSKVTGTYSLLAVTEHEIDEVLGLGSSLGIGFPAPSAEDLFRFNASGGRSYSLDGSAAYFELYSGGTKLEQFNNSSNGADSGDWASGFLSSAQIQDAYGTGGSTPSLSATSVEVQALDAIGYTVLNHTSGQSSTPEPGTALLLGGALVLGGLAKRRIG